MPAPDSGLRTHAGRRRLSVSEGACPPCVRTKRAHICNLMRSLSYYGHQGNKSLGIGLATPPVEDPDWDQNVVNCLIK